MKEIVVYTTPTCPWCTKIKEFLKDKGAQFKEVDVSNDGNAAREMMEKSGQLGVPQIQIGNKIIVGFDKDKIEKELGNEGDK